jgi:hypothetical protein
VSSLRLPGPATATFVLHASLTPRVWKIAVRNGTLNRDVQEVPDRRRFRRLRVIAQFGNRLASGGRQHRRRSVRTEQFDDLTIDRWRLEPRFHALELEEAQEQDQAPPLWKDLVFAAIFALLLWVVAGAVFG